VSNIVNFTLENLDLPVGATVTWTNQDVVIHTSTSGIPAGPSDLWDSPVLPAGSSFSFTFTEEGTFSYFCRIHPSIMQATVTVGPPGTAVSAALPEVVAGSGAGNTNDDDDDDDDSMDSDY
jgi:hypothetical protein